MESWGPTWTVGRGVEKDGRMFFEDIVNRGSTPALEKMLAYTEARQRVLADNVANIDNPHYRAKQLDTDAFQASLRRALDDRKVTGDRTFRLEAHDEFRVGRDGRLQVTPSLEPPENVLFHDDTNARVEKQMAMMAENNMMHQVVVEMLHGRFNGLLKAIRGRLG